MNDETPRTTDYAGPFTEMAQAIEANKGQSYGGAFVIVPPVGASQSVLILDSQQDPAQLIAMIQARCAILLGQLEDENKRRLSPFGR